MHAANRAWLHYLSLRYKEYFNDDAKVLEIGSYNVNGSAREYFSKKCEYVGVDREDGPDVDVVMEAQDTEFEEEYFDTLVYMSVFEHDPDWARGFEHNLKWIRPHGLLVVCWGAEGNLPHPPEPWAPIPAGAFMEKVKEGWPVRILDYFYEKDRYPDTDVAGVFNVLAVKRMEESWKQSR